MALSKQTVISKIEVLEDETIQMQRALRVFDDDGTLIGERFHRMVFPPTTDPATLPVRVRRIAQLIWTPEVIAAYQAAQGNG